ncbi:MAG: hypothetical protein SV966_03685 [Actinomycetota bacterium]|nr:hypothetical protein [Actinomycetota bacterium]
MVNRLVHHDPEVGSRLGRPAKAEHWIRFGDVEMAFVEPPDKPAPKKAPPTRRPNKEAASERGARERARRNNRSCRVANVFAQRV